MAADVAAVVAVDVLQGGTLQMHSTRTPQGDPIEVYKSWCVRNESRGSCSRWLLVFAGRDITDARHGTPLDDPIKPHDDCVETDKVDMMTGCWYAAGWHSTNAWHGNATG